AIKTRNCSFPAGITSFGDREPYTRQNVLTFGGCFFVCGSGRQPIQRDKTANDNYYLLTLAAIAKEIEARGVPRECGVTIAAGLPLTSYGREKPAFRKYLLRNGGQLIEFGYEGKKYRITIEDVLLFPQGFTALMTQPDLLADEPSMLLLDIGGWTVDLMRIDNGRPIIDTCHSLEFGMIRCIDEVRERVRQNTGLSLTDAQIEQVLAGCPCSLEESVRSLIREQGRLYTERLLSAVLEAGFDYHALPVVVVMMGGGASVVSRHVRPVRLSASASISLRETARDLESPAGAFIAERPVNSLCRTVTLLDDRVNAQGYLLSNVCVATSFYQRSANHVFFIYFSICETYCTLSTAPQRRNQQSGGLLVSPRESPRGMRRSAGPDGGSLTESVGLLFCCYSPGRRVGASSGTRTARARRPLRRAKRLLRSYAGVCLQGLVIALACIIFSALSTLSTSAPAVDAGSSAITAVWSYVGTLAFNLLVLVGAVKGCDRIVKEIMGL
ncbi:ParM/StbA family protein, partial [uncultured Subdoligranulum sp.]|uniref:ParM/StbA family protein n=1 Tax=uncultured Subdoligranulum sp. TaxID=512298 RepID=UPI0025ECA761